MFGYFWISPAWNIHFLRGSGANAEHLTASYNHIWDILGLRVAELPTFRWRPWGAQQPMTNTGAH